MVLLRISLLFCSCARGNGQNNLNIYQYGLQKRFILNEVKDICFHNTRMTDVKMKQLSFTTFRMKAKRCHVITEACSRTACLSRWRREKKSRHLPTLKK